MQDRDAQHARGMQEASERVVHDLEAKTTQLRGQLERSQQALHAVKAQYGQQETLVQTQQHMDKLQSDLASERQKVTKLTGKSQEVAKAKQDVLLATKALQVGKIANCQSYLPDLQDVPKKTRSSSSICPSNLPWHLTNIKAIRLFYTIVPAVRPSLYTCLNNNCQGHSHVIQQRGLAFRCAAMHLQAKEKQVGRLQLKLQRQQSAIQEIEALKVCLIWTSRM